MPSTRPITSEHIERRAFAETAARRLCAENLNPLLAAVLATRGIKTKAEIAYPPNQLPKLSTGDAMEAAKLIARAIRNQKNICVIGDHGTDGICATAFAVLALRSIGITASWLVTSPKFARRNLDPSLVQRAVAEGAQLLVVADCNGDLQAGIALARKHNMRVVVVSHHLLGGQRQRFKADAIANPMLPNSGLATTGLCASAIMFFLFKQVYRLIGARHRLYRLLDLVAVATLADARPMNDACNRSIVAYGAFLIRCGRCRNIFKEILGEKRDNFSLTTLKRNIIPILNCAHMHRDGHFGVQALLADRIVAARKLAGELQLTRLRFTRLAARIERQAPQLDNIASNQVIVLYRPHWINGQAEIAVAALAEKFAVPIFIVCGTEPNCIGTAQGTSDISVTQVFGAMTKALPRHFGFWHADEHEGKIKVRTQAQECCDLFAKLCRPYLRNAWEQLEVDADLTDTELDQTQRQSLLDIPWGPGFAAPLFSARVRIERNLTLASGTNYAYLIKLGNTRLIAQCDHPLKAQSSGAKIVFYFQEDASSIAKHDVNIVKMIDG